ncbi:helix-turn-helix domain-containing protein [Enterococcus sp. 22-H-5-01]|uniref:helix-turn-helix domain-containing protein n=1 Tax=Enterococcus sp. 22-H-5-01 TaxID=3418555 RepID=UPI003D03EBD7
MGLYERIKDVAKSKKLSIAYIERENKLSNGSISKWSKNAPSIEKLDTVANYLNVSTDYLLGKTENPSRINKLASSDLDDILDDMMSFDGKPMTDNDRIAIRAYLEGRFSSK